MHWGIRAPARPFDARALRGRRSRKAPPPRYAELQTTTNFGFLRGASQPGELVLAAKALGHPAIGIADRNTLAGVVRAWTQGKAIGQRVLTGSRLVFADGTPEIVVYPTDREAWGRLTRLLTLGQRRAKKGECHLARPRPRRPTPRAS